MFSDALLAAENYYNKFRYEGRKKEQKDKHKFSANKEKKIKNDDKQKIQKQVDAQGGGEELIAVRDPKILRKIQKTHEVNKSAYKSVIEDAIVKNTAATRDGLDQPNQGDHGNYGFVSQEASAFRVNVMKKYNNLSEEPKCPIKNNAVIQDLSRTRKTVKNAMHHADVTISHKIGRRDDNEKDLISQQKYEPYEKVRDEKLEKPKEKKQLPAPMDFYQKKNKKKNKKNKSEPINIVAKQQVMEPELDRVMPKNRNTEYDKGMTQRKQEKMKVEKSCYEKVLAKCNKPENETKLDLNVIDRVPEQSDKYHGKQLHDHVKSNEREKSSSTLYGEKDNQICDTSFLKYEQKKLRKYLEIRKKYKSERERIDKNIGQLNRDNNEEKNVDVKIPNKYQTDKWQSDINCSKTNNSDDRKQIKVHAFHEKTLCKEQLERSYSRDKSSKIKQKVHEFLKTDGMNKSGTVSKGSQGSKELPFIKFEDSKLKAKSFTSSSQITNSFNFDEYVSSIKRKCKPDDFEKKKRKVFKSESDVNDCIDEEKVDYSRYIKKIFGYNKSKFQDADKNDGHKMEPSYSQKQREKYNSKKIRKNGKESKKRRIGDD